MPSNQEIDGILLVDKAAGMTSHDVVSLARRTLKTRKIGHCGTLDPLATGLLILTIGRGTKIQDLLMSEDKEYIGTMRLGEITDTQDADGHILETRPVPHMEKSKIEQAFAKYRGDFYQIPPMVSAIKKDGIPLYKLARQGKQVERQPRFVHVYSSSVLDVQLPDVAFQIICSKGFYVRTFAHDVGQELGCGAHLRSLRRTKSGKFSVENAITIQQMESLAASELRNHILTLPQVSRLRGA